MRLIDADKISYCNYDLDNYFSFRAVTEEEIAEMPTVEAEPVVHAHWVDTEFGTLCSACTRCYDPDFEIRRKICRELKRCPDCGAHMDEEVAE